MTYLWLCLDAQNSLGKPIAWKAADQRGKANLNAFVHECLEHAFLEPEQSPAAKHNDSQLAETEHIGVNSLQHAEHPLQQGHCKPHNMGKDAKTIKCESFVCVWHIHVI